MSFGVCPDLSEVAQPFGCTSYTFEVPDPDCAGGHIHLGIDLVRPNDEDSSGCPVFATRPGVIFAVGTDCYLEDHDLGPNAVCLAADDGVWCWFGHLEACWVAVGQRVSVGDALGLTGSLGVSTGPHLHFEVRQAIPCPSGAPEAIAGAVDPGPWLDPLPVPPAPDAMPAEVFGFPVVVTPPGK